jgi:hypothetical protein
VNKWELDLLGALDYRLVLKTVDVENASYLVHRSVNNMTLINAINTVLKERLTQQFLNQIAAIQRLIRDGQAPTG